jgi:putative hemolysin
MILSVIARSEATKQSTLTLWVDCFASLARTGGRFTAAPAEYREASPNARRDRQGCRTNARACPRGDASQPTIQDAIPLRAGSAARQNRRRSSGIHCAACSRRSPHRMCIRKSRCALPQHAVEDPYRNIRSSAGVAAPWSSRWLKRGGSSQIKRRTRMANLPRFRPFPRKFTAATP